LADYFPSTFKERPVWDLGFTERYKYNNMVYASQKYAKSASTMSYAGPSPAQYRFSVDATFQDVESPEDAPKIRHRIIFQNNFLYMKTLYNIMGMSHNK